MAPEMDFENFSTYADVDKEYDFEAEIERAKEYILQKERFEKEARLLELEARIREIEIERQRKFYDEEKLIERVLSLLRGKIISQRAYNVIIREIIHCAHPEIDDYYNMRQKEELRRMVEGYKRMMMMPEPKLTFRWDSDNCVEEKKDFIEEDDMKL